MERWSVASVAGFFLIVCSTGVTVFGGEQERGFFAFRRAGTLLAECKSGDLTPASLCTGYVTGVADTLSSLGLACLPDKQVNVQQLINVTVKYLEDHPEQEHLAAPTVMSTAFSRAFPCPPVKR